jgi:hypothetical protein
MKFAISSNAEQDSISRFPVPTKTATSLTATPDGAFRAAIQVSEVGTERYLDKSWRVK